MQQQQGSAPSQQTAERERLENRYKSIGIPALAAAVGAARAPAQPQPRQMNAQMPEWLDPSGQS